MDITFSCQLTAGAAAAAGSAMAMRHDAAEAMRANTPVFVVTWRSLEGRSPLIPQNGHTHYAYRQQLRGSHSPGWMV
eukprot:3632817-Pleurochrysis_carterae.AAC.1